MDVYGGGVSSTADSNFPIDDLLDFSNDQLFSSSSFSSNDSDVTPTQNYLPTPHSHSHAHAHAQPIVNNGLNYHHHHISTDFTNDLCAVPSDDVAELEWLSQFVDDSFTDFPANELAGAMAFRTEASPETGQTKQKSGERGSPAEGEVRRCTHCASEKTPQWRTGPLGPKTLCNACGVRFKSGRLVPEYRPAASPTFVLTQHSNSHRKVMELRRQKELTSEQQQEQMYHHHHRQVC
ncbi:GATA transcription factor 2-like [Quercus lobata]|uniref:GATA transcription factor 2-like n=1 Tax=Quercus lobata TaxID=97700 RepID=UPI001247F70A|nr:GATA transcription factor 2-like [Quercus lobata]